jgi:hypothetical protein
MRNEAKITRLIQTLQKEGIEATNEFASDISKLVQTEFDNFAVQIFKDFVRRDFEAFNRFEKLHLNEKQRKEINGRILWRYEYRHTSNLRCIFIIEKEQDKDTPTLICAFNEDGDKGKGTKSYEDNIKRAIRIINEE